MQREAAIDRLFVGDMVENILAAVEREASSGSADAEWAAKISAIDAYQIAAQPQTCAGASAAWQNMGFRDVHAHGIPHSVARHPRA